ncbi:MAG: plasmid stabilization protein [Kiritimatiellae bacterium]|nr:plasmid stabilization protein [Kiritimatiellia bacterium]
MKYRLVFTASFTRRACKYARKHPELLDQYEKALRLLELDPFHPSLRLHKLKGALGELHSVSINLAYRITIEFLIDRDAILLVNIGSHDEVY